MSCDSFVYMNKIFESKSAPACPLMRPITINGSNSIQKLTIEQDGCCCQGGSPCIDIIDTNSLEIEDISVNISNFYPKCPENLKADDVTLNGLPVDYLTYQNSQYFAEIKNILPEINECQCLEHGIANKAYFMINAQGPWLAALTIVISGKAYGCCSCTRFNLCITTKDVCPVVIDGNSTFSISKLKIPCSINGIAPVIRFSYGGSGNILQPELTLEPGHPCTFVLKGTLVANPTVDVQVTRQTLFKVKADPVELPCDDLVYCYQCDSCDYVPHDKDDDCDDDCSDDCHDNDHDECHEGPNKCHSCQVYNFNGCKY